MAETEHELMTLVSLAKLDAMLRKNRTELSTIPKKIDALKQSIAQIEESHQSATARVGEMEKEKRSLEQKLQDDEAQIKKYKDQLMTVKTNKEYTAMVHEIDHLKENIGAKEERLLILMDELDQLSAQNKEFSSKGETQKAEILKERKILEDRMAMLAAETEKLDVQKPPLFSHLDARIKKLYDRLIGKLGDCAVANVLDESCQGCFSRVTPQRAVEVRKNDHIITCEACGRILVHYDTADV